MPLAMPGSPPSSRTTPLTDFDSSQTSGRAAALIRSSNGAENSAIFSERCSAIRFGASSPSTRVKKEMPTVTTAIDSVEARPPDSPSRRSTVRSALARVAAPNAPVSSVATVTPICTADRKRFGSWASFAARCPRLPRWLSALT